MVLYIQMLGMKFDKGTVNLHWLAFAKVPKIQGWKGLPYETKCIFVVNITLRLKASSAHLN